MTTRRLHRRVYVTGDPCACDGDRPCLLHYDLLDVRQRLEARRRLSVHGPLFAREARQIRRAAS